MELYTLSHLLRQQKNKGIIINHKGAQMAKDGEDRHRLGTNNKLEKVGLNFSEYT